MRVTSASFALACASPRASPSVYAGLFLSSRKPLFHRLNPVSDFFFVDSTM